MNLPGSTLFASSLVFADTAPASSGGLSLTAGLLVVVVAALLVLARMVSDLRARIAALEQSRGTTSQTPPSVSRPLATAPLAQPPTPVTTAGPIPAEILAVITAAIHVTLGREARVVGIAPARIDDQTWSLEGRRLIFHSHKVR